MTQKSAFPFSAMMPGFDFMQQLASSSTSSPVPGLQHWIAPTVNIEELDQRIKELKTVQFWLEQNTLGVKGTIQALEVQKMTLQTLQGMNLSMNEIAKAFTLPLTSASADRDQEKAASTPPAKADDENEGETTSHDEAEPTSKQKGSTIVDPLQWWSALGQQFQQIAAETLRDATERATAPAPATSKSAVKSTKSRAKPATAKKAAKKAAKKKAGTTAKSAGSSRNGGKTAPKK